MKTPIRAPRQCELELPTWGGRREGAGPKPAVPRERPALPHRTRPEQRPCQPVHVTLRMLDHVWNLRSQRSFAVIHGALWAVCSRRDIRITHFSNQGNHLHLIAEAEGNGALSSGIRALSIRIARGLNGMMGRRGPVREDRYHAHVLRTPAEVRNAVRYAVGNFESHAARRGERTSGRFVDPFSSCARDHRPVATDVGGCHLHRYHRYPATRPVAAAQNSPRPACTVRHGAWAELHPSRSGQSSEGLSRGRLRQSGPGRARGPRCGPSAFPSAVSPMRTPGHAP